MPCSIESVEGAAGAAGARRAPARETAAQRGEIARDEHVPQHGDRLGEEHAGGDAPAQESVAAQHVAASEATVASRGGRATPVGGRAHVHADGVRFDHRAPARDAQAHDEIEILHVEGERLIEPPNLLPSRSAVGARRVAGPHQNGSGVGGVRQRKPPQTSEPGECDVGCETEAIDRLAIHLQQQRGHGPHLCVCAQRRDHPLEEIRVAVDIVVEVHDELATPRRDTPVAGYGEGLVLLEGLDVHLRPLAAQTCTRFVGGAVIHDDHAMIDALSLEMAQTALGEIPPVVGDDHHIHRLGHCATLRAGGIFGKEQQERPRRAGPSGPQIGRNVSSGRGFAGAWAPRGLRAGDSPRREVSNRRIMSSVGG